MAMPSKYVIIAEVTGAVNTATTTGIINVSDYDYIGCAWSSDIVIAASTISIYGYLDVAGTKPVFIRGGTWTAGQNLAATGIGPGVTHTQNGAVAVPQAVPAAIQVVATAAGAGVTVSIRVYGRRKHRGPDVSITPD